MQQVHGENQQPLSRLALNEDAFDPTQGALRNADALPLPEVRMRQGGEARIQRGVNGRNLGIWDDAQSIPAFPENPHQAAGLAYLKIAGLLERMAQEQVPREHGDGDAVPCPGPVRPHVYLGQENVEAFGRQLIAD